MWDWSSGKRAGPVRSFEELSGRTYSRAMGKGETTQSRYTESFGGKNLCSSIVLAVQSCPTLCDPMDCSPPGFSVHGILQARILEWVAISFWRGSSPPRDQTQVSCTAGRFFTI